MMLAGMGCKLGERQALNVEGRVDCVVRTQDDHYGSKRHERVEGQHGGPE